MWVSANWPAPANVHAGCTTRRGGVSRPPFDSLNPARHTGDSEAATARNRAHLRRELGLPSEPLWLEQVHGNTVVRLPESRQRRADAACTGVPGTVCAILTADCVPVLLCRADGREIAAVHAGWRGLCAGVLENTLAAVAAPGADWLAWIGPHICARHYEVGDEVRVAVLERYPEAASVFRAPAEDRWWFNLQQLIVMILQTGGITDVSASGLCNFEAADRFYSYRRDGRTGRMASLIWMDPTPP